MNDVRFWIGQIWAHPLQCLAKSGCPFQSLTKFQHRYIKFEHFNMLIKCIAIYICTKYYCEVKTKVVISQYQWWHHNTSGDITILVMTSQYQWWYHNTSGDITIPVVTSQYQWWHQNTNNDITILVAISQYQLWYHNTSDYITIPVVNSQY